MNSDYNDLRPPLSLSLVERQILALQHQILAHLDLDEAEYHRRMTEVLSQGFTMEYESVFSPYAELPKDDCKLVFDILDMFRVIKASLAELEESDRDRLMDEHKYVLAFQGFDGNDAREGKMASYVDYLQSTDRWTDLRSDVQAADGGNSHAPMLSRYATMLEVFKPIWQEVMRSPGGPGHLLDAEQLRQVAEAEADAGPATP